MELANPRDLSIKRGGVTPHSEIMVGDEIL